ncbi:hypothetical protein V8C86DRAFT_2707363, partial [Haematococcus lacustris]
SRTSSSFSASFATLSAACITWASWWAVSPAGRLPVMMKCATAMDGWKSVARCDSPSAKPINLVLKCSLWAPSTVR